MLASAGIEAAGVLRVGVIGAGMGAGYVAGFQRQPGVQVAAVCARTPTRMIPLAERYRVPHVYTDFEEMLRQEPLDMVAISTPNCLHHPLTLASLESGKHVLCDKPLGLNVSQAREMVERADLAGRKHFVPYIWRFLPAVAHMKDLITLGFLGNPYHASVRYHHAGWGDPQGPMRWQYDKAQAGSGALANVGSHAIDLIHWCLGGFRRVAALLSTEVNRRPLADGTGWADANVDDVCTFLGELQDGTPVVFDLSSVALGPRVRLEVGIYGSEGALILQDEFGTEDALTGRLFSTRRGGGGPLPVPIPAHLAVDPLELPDHESPLRICLHRMASEFVEAIRGDRSATPNFRDGLRAQLVIDAVLRSAAEQRWVLVEGG